MKRMSRWLLNFKFYWCGKNPPLFHFKGCGRNSVILWDYTYLIQFHYGIQLLNQINNFRKARGMKDFQGNWTIDLVFENYEFQFDGYQIFLNVLLLPRLLRGLIIQWYIFVFQNFSVLVSTSVSCSFLTIYIHVTQNNFQYLCSFLFYL